MAKLIDIAADGWFRYCCILVIIHDSQEASCPHFFSQTEDCWLQSCTVQLYHSFGTSTNPASARDTWSGAVLIVCLLAKIAFFLETRKTKKNKNKNARNRQTREAQIWWCHPRMSRVRDTITRTRHTMYSCMLLLLRHLSQRYPQAARFACPHFAIDVVCRTCRTHLSSPPPI